MTRTRWRLLDKGLQPLVLLAVLAGAFLGCPNLAPLLSVSPTAFSFDTAHTQDSFVLSNDGPGTLTWSVDSKPDWITVTPSTGEIKSASQVVAIAADLEDLAPGNYAGEVGIASSSGKRGIAVSAVVIAPPKLEVSPTLLDFGGSATSKTFAIRNTGGGILNWTILPPLSNWVTVNPASGQTAAGKSTIVTVTADRSGLSPGSQVGPVLIQLSSNAGTRIVTVQANIQSFFVDPTILDFGAQIDQLPLTIQNTGEEDIHWTITASAAPAWVKLPPDALSGTLASGDQQSLLVGIDRVVLGTGSASGQIPFSSDGGQDTVEVRAQGPQPVLTALPLALDFGSSRSTDAFTIGNTGTGTLAWAVEPGLVTQGNWAAADAPWLSAAPANGQTASGEITPVTLAIDRSKVNPDPNVVYRSDLRILSADGQQAFVAVTMAALPPTLRVLPVDLHFGTTFVNKNVAIWNAGLDTLTWRIDTSGKPAWASLEPVDAGGIASGSVSGEQTASVKVSVNRAGLAPADQDYAWSFQVTAEDGAGNALAAVTVNVTMNVAKVPAIGVDTGETNGVPNIDNTGIAFIPLGTIDNSGYFVIRNQGTGPLSWQIDTSVLPSWITSIEPSQGVVASLREVTVVVKVNREDLAFGSASQVLAIISNDPIRASVPVRVEMQIPKVLIVGVRPGEIAMGLYTVSDSFQVANLGDPGSVLNFEISSTKPWLYFYPATGSSEGTSEIIKDWRDVDISIDRAQIEGTGSTGELVVTAFETDENGVRKRIEGVKEQRLTVTVQAAPLSFEAAKARTRIPSLVRLTMLMRDIAYEPIRLPDSLLDEYVRSFAFFVKDVPIELSETTEFLTSGSNLRTSAAILLDYSGSMFAAAQSVSDPSISGAPDPLQALYERCITPLINELPDGYAVTLMEFHDRSQPTRIVGNGPIFTTDKDLLRQRLNSIAIRDHGATELLPAVLDAAMLIDAHDVSRLLIPFDDADVRALICVTDGRLTTPPGRTKDTLDALATLKVRFLPIGWGQGVLHEPLARIASGTGGHYYPTPLEITSQLDNQGNPIRIPIVNTVLDWCSTEDPAIVPCDQSVAKDLKSQVVLSYVTLTEDAPVTIRVDARFDNPNDDDGVCLPEQGLIGGTFTQKQLDFLAIAGDARLGQISLRSEGLQGGHARVVIRTEYVPRNIDAFEFQISCPQPFNPPVLNDNFLKNWTLDTPAPGVYRLQRPADGGPLPYGSFGDMMYLDFPDPIPAAGVVLTFDVADPVYDASDFQGKYIVRPDTLTVSPLGSFAPAFPSPEIKTFVEGIEQPALYFGNTDTTATISIRNIGGSHVPTGVWLDWKVTDTPSYLAVDDPTEGFLISTLDTHVLNVTLDRTVASGVYLSSLGIQFESKGLGLAPVVLQIPVYLTVLPPVLDVLSPDFLAGTYTLDFGDATQDLTFQAANIGQSSMHWTMATAPPVWLSASLRGGNILMGETQDVKLTVDRTKVPTGSYAVNLLINSDGGTKTVTVNMTVP